MFKWSKFCLYLNLLLISSIFSKYCSLRDMENANTKLLHALRKSGAEKIFEAYQWLQQHRHELNKEVFGPVLLEVYVS